MISVITVVFNSEKYIENTIKSVINQSFKDIQYIIVDGGSTDNTLNIIKKYSNHISILISEKDNGIYHAMNKGIDLAKGEWINFMNAGDIFVDDYVLENTFKQYINNNISFIYSDWYLYDSFSEIHKKDFIKSSYEKGQILHQSVIYKKKLHDQYGKYLITSKIIISDYIFFNLIPKDEIFKSSYPISINDKNGISSNYWSLEQKIAIDFVLYRITFKKMFFSYIKYILHRLKKGYWVLK